MAWTVKTKCYKFSNKGLNKAIADRKNEKINKYIDIGFYGIIGVLCLSGIINFNSIIHMIACSSTSKVVKILMK
jgi:hypothetical protein